MKLVLQKEAKKKTIRTTIAWSVLILGTILGIQYWHTFPSGSVIYVPLTSAVFIYRRDWRLFLLTLIGSIVIENAFRMSESSQVSSISTRLFFLLVALTANGRYIKLLVKQGWEGETSRDKKGVADLLTNDRALKSESLEKVAFVLRIVALLWIGLLALKLLIIIKPFFQTAEIQYKIAALLIFGSVVCLVSLMRKPESMMPVIWLVVTGVLLLFISVPVPINFTFNGVRQVLPSQLNGVVVLSVAIAHIGKLWLRRTIKMENEGEMSM